MTNSRKYNNDAFAAIHIDASDLLEVGEVDITTMRGFDADRIAVPEPLAPTDIKRLRRRLHVSQPVFARYLNTTESTVAKWEVGARSPSGMALKLLHVAKKSGLAALL